MFGPKGCKIKSSDGASDGDESRPRVFLSARFGPGGAEEEVNWMRDQLEALRVVVYPSRSPGNLDRVADNANGVKLCDLFVFFGQAHYGEKKSSARLSVAPPRYDRLYATVAAYIAPSMSYDIDHESMHRLSSRARATTP